MTLKTWKSHPISTVIIETLYKKGALIDTELHNILKDEFSELSFCVFNSELMRLEIEGLIHVSALKKGKRRVELLKERGKH